MVNRFSMKIFDASDSRQLLELLHGAYADDLSQTLNKQLEKTAQGTLPPPNHHLPTRE